MGIISWHDHLSSFWESYCTSDISCSKIELWSIAIKEWFMSSTFFFSQCIYICFKFSMRINTFWFS
uniref:Uncharacterized protein n=1 Tax=uncultured gamma proteobacterium EB080_L93H08 TaxID=710973 RepID=E0Y2K2_9GAMM|nr:hypothetical protein [uncultured gamma proteobacterium EB080_L93H08]